MPISKRTFSSAGQLSQHLIPATYSRIDSIKGQGGLASANNGTIMGQSTGGEPTTLLQFNSVAEAVDTLKGGSLMEAVRLGFNPGNGLTPQRLYAVRVNPAVQSTIDLDDGSANAMIQVDSKDWGLSQNQINVTVEAGSVEGKKITIGFKSNTETFDDVIQESIEITHASATGTIINSSGGNSLTLSVGPLTALFATYTTLADLAVWINDQSGYTATVTAGQEEASTTELDSITTESLVGGYQCESTMFAILNKLNNESNYVEASDVHAANDIEIPANLSLTYMASGVEGTYDASAWTASLTMLEAEDVQFISTPDSTAAFHAQIKTHVESMSSVTGRKERQFLVGGAWGDSVATATAASAVLNSRWGLYAFNGFVQYDVNGVVQNYAAAYYAGLLLGQKVAAAINAPLTYKTLNVISLEDKLTDSELETLIEGGVCTSNLNPTGIPITVRQVNSYQTDDLKWNEFSMVTEMGFVSRDLRTYLDGLFIGKPGTAVYAGAIRGAVESKLEIYTDLGIFTRDSDRIAWWNVQIAISGDTVTVDYDAYVTAPINFIFVTSHFHEVVTTA